MSSLKQAQDKKLKPLQQFSTGKKMFTSLNVQRWELKRQGETIEEAIANLREATEPYLDEFPLSETAPRRLLTTFEVTTA